MSELETFQTPHSDGKKFHTWTIRKIFDQPYPGAGQPLIATVEMPNRGQQSALFVRSSDGRIHQTSWSGPYATPEITAFYQVKFP